MASLAPIVLVAACGQETRLERTRDVMLALATSRPLADGITMGLVRSGGDPRTGLTVRPGARATMALQPGPDAVLETYVAIPDGEEATSVTFLVEMEHAGTLRDVARKTVAGADIGWHPWSVPLAVPGRFVLHLRTEGSAGAWAAPQVRSGGRPSRVPDRREVAMLLSLDTVRVDRIGAYGHDGMLTGQLDAVLRRSRLYPEAMSTSHWTLPAHASMLTGAPADVHGAGLRNAAVPQDLPMLPELLAEDGWDTAAFVADVAWLGPRFGMDRGFRIHLETVEPTGSRIGRVRDYLESAGPRRLFVFVHLFDAHSDTYHPYDASPEALALCAPWATALEPCAGTRCGSAMLQQLVSELGRLPRRPERGLRQRYEAGILDLDHEVGRLVAELRGVGFFHRGVLAVVSDHGEELGDHGGYLHPRLQPEVTRALLAFRLPGGEGTIEAGIPTVADVAPTLAARFGLRLPPSFALAHDLERVRPTMAYAWSASGAATLRTLDRAATVDADGGRSVYDLDADPSQHRPSPPAPDDPLAGELASRMERHRAERARLEAATARTTTEEDERLRSLGYLR